MTVLSKEEYEAFKINCPKCGNQMIMGSVKNKELNIVQVVKNGITYICLKCMGKNGRF